VITPSSAARVWSARQRLIAIGVRHVGRVLDLFVLGDVAGAVHERLGYCHTTDQDCAWVAIEQRIVGMDGGVTLDPYPLGRHEVHEQHADLAGVGHVAS